MSRLSADKNAVFSVLSFGMGVAPYSDYFHRVDQLQREFDEMIRRCDAAIKHLESHGHQDAIDYADIRQRISWLLTSLKHHQAREADLVYEAYGLDIRIGD